MKIRVVPTQDIEKLKQNLENRVEDIDIEEDELIVKTEKQELISKTPGIESYVVDGEEKPGVGGKPVSKQAYAKIDSEEDAVKALIATVKGYNLVVLNTEREWDYRQLKKYNPNIKRIKSDSPKQDLGIEYAVFPHQDYEQVETPVQEDEIEIIYRTMLT